MLQPVNSPVQKDLIPAALPAHRMWTGMRVYLFVESYNTNKVRKDELPKTYADLLDPKWKGQESMGHIEDRTKENLVGTDNGIIMTRNRLLQAAKTVQGGGTPPGTDGASQRVRAFASVLPRSAPIHSAPEMQVTSVKK